MIDANDIKYIVQSNIKYILIISIIFFIISQYLDTNIIFMISILLFIIVNYKSILNTFNDIKKSIPKERKIIEDNIRLKRDTNFDSELTIYLNKLKRFKKYNPHSWNEGYNYIKMFIHTIDDLERDDIAHPKQYFENARLYLRKSLNSFQSIGLSVPEENYIQSLKYNKLEANKLSNRIGKLCKKIYKHCFYLLYNLSLRFNEDFFKDPNTHKNEIGINTDLVEEANIYDYHELY
tara:strand:- start:25 stop:729 length:705 start_codon:yes stop_codon:yes gene_type:complete